MSVCSFECCVLCVVCACVPHALSLLDSLSRRHLSLYACTCEREREPLMSPHSSQSHLRHACWEGGGYMRLRVQLVLKRGMLLPGAEFLSRTKLKAGQEGVGGGYSTAPPMVLRAPRRCPALTHVIGTSRREGGGAQRVCRAARRYGGTTCCYASLTRSPVLTGRVLQPDPGTVGRTGEGGTEHPGSISALSLRHVCCWPRTCLLPPYAALRY